ncbi:MAG: ribonuclease catalytic domain-containing protein [Treponema sp.]|nr:ribonuclease catalytic domain-containing protein [Treponema sp.]
MINENSLVIYKGKPAIVKDKSDGKITIVLPNKEQVKVRDKDIELLHPGPVKNFDEIGITNQFDSSVNEQIKEAWELLLDDITSHHLKELASLIYNEYTPAAAFAVYSLLQDGLYFSGTIEAIIPRAKNEVESEEKKRNDKLRESDERSQFLDKIKTCLKKPDTQIFLHNDTNIEDSRKLDLRFMQDVEALAFGKTEKSRTMKELGLSETCESAHSLLLKSGFWTTATNPHPSRFGLSFNSADIKPDVPNTLCEEERSNLCHLLAFAIDSPWSCDPDDALSIEALDGDDFSGDCALYVHVADPASSIVFDSKVEKDARERGATLYLPEGAVRMLSDDFIQMYALGLAEKSLALTFKMTINKQGAVTAVDVFPSIIKVRRITYEEADKQIDNADSQDAKTLRVLYELSQRIFKRRREHGAVNIELPDVHITINNNQVKVEPLTQFRSASLVRDCMIAAGEGAGSWAAARSITFPYISQETEMQGKILPDTPGFADSWQLRKCMRPRCISTKPGCHQGLGLDIYSQVTSPLRRYTDLLAHLQLRAFLRGETPLNTDEVAARLGYSEAAAAAVNHAERASNNHWLMVYLCDKKDSVWEAVVLGNAGNRTHVVIPLLALETQVSLQKSVQPNENVQLVLKSVNIPKGEAVFVHQQPHHNTNKT